MAYVSRSSSISVTPNSTGAWSFRGRIMNVTPAAATNAANLALFMVNLSYRLLRDFRQRDPDYSVLDLKATCRGYKYVDQTIILPRKDRKNLSRFY